MSSDEKANAAPFTDLPEPFRNAAGWIQNLDVAGNVSIIHCAPGSRRSSHWHKEDHHWLYVLTGRMEYWERPVGSTAMPKQVTVLADEMVFTGPGVEHWSSFPEGAILVSVSKLHRTHENHEADLVRVKWWDE